MRIGLLLNVLGTPLDAVVEQARDIAASGLGTAWLPELGAWDAVTAAAAIGPQVPGLTLGTSVVPTYPRHPLTLAAQALTAQAATGNRFTLGVGVSHRHIIEGQFGHSYDRPARHLREYLSVLAPLLRGESVTYEGETIKAAGAVTAPGAEPPALLVGALGPAMLKVAGELADGTITAWAGKAALADHIVPTITQAATRAGRPAPRVVAFKAVGVTAHPEARRATMAEQFSQVDQIPHYRAVLDRDGSQGPQDTAALGDESTVEQALRELLDAGATELIASPVGTPEEQSRTLALLAELTASTAP
ncbi:TIGR03564 family F420-dependent LLM class oxidoreductase [Streptomyces sp. NBS 14/10]|uniref:TIGR03564 family F420-dependent LLM class oxidoreductase n=1 Tax=Streptomyces sp. NBS 14/10 TaxID=1945643 RepID=UPI000B7EB1D7|nr:TIGR03564 family F420-dependent LLM class oxidoreductase [Streptomyces sp. NBS 14/10]KAK1181005.1 TIGR03564 family F420-dependent LLM class oxidoreductase [Streptomyces sp. NBS 14/10]